MKKSDQNNFSDKLIIEEMLHINLKYVRMWLHAYSVMSDYLQPDGL